VLHQIENQFGQVQHVTDAADYYDASVSFVHITLSTSTMQQKEQPSNELSVCVVHCGKQEYLGLIHYLLMSLFLAKRVQV
jgi:hypothetical protein